MYTHGAPRAGDAAFAQAYDDLFGAITYRFVNRDAPLDADQMDHNADDFVTMMPITATDSGYRHVGRYFAIYREFEEGDDDLIKTCFVEEPDKTSMEPADPSAALHLISIKGRHSSKRYASDLTRFLLNPPAAYASGMTPKDTCVFQWLYMDLFSREHK